jgi:hypothetical protein
MSVKVELLVDNQRGVEIFVKALNHAWGLGGAKLIGVIVNAALAKATLDKGQLSLDLGLGALELLVLLHEDLLLDHRFRHQLLRKSGCHFQNNNDKYLFIFEN